MPVNGMQVVSTSAFAVKSFTAKNAMMWSIVRGLQIAPEIIKQHPAKYVMFSKCGKCRLRSQHVKNIFHTYY